MALLSRSKAWVTVAASTGVALALLFAWMLLSHALPHLGGEYTVSAMLPDTGSLANNAGVRIAGQPVGYVTEIDRRGTAVMVKMHIDDEYTPLKANSRVRLQLRTLVGENFIDLDPGQAGPDLPDGGVLPISQADDYVQIDKILDTLRGPSRDRARQVIGSLGGAVDGRGDELNDTLNGAAGFVTKADPIVGILGKDRQQVARLVDNLGQLTAAIGERDDAIRSLAHDSRTVFSAVAARDEALKATMDELPPTLRQARSTTGLVEQITPQVSPVLDNLAGAITDLRPTVDLLEPAATQGRALVGELGRASVPLKGTLNRIVSASDPTARAIPPVREVLCQVNPALEYIRPYTRELAGLFSGLASATNYYDATGHASQLLVTAGENSAGFLSEDLSEALANARQSGLVAPSYSMGYNPYPKPGIQPVQTVGAESNGPYDSPQNFTRVYSECGPGTRASGQR